MNIFAKSHAYSCTFVGLLFATCANGYGQYAGKQIGDSSADRATRPGSRAYESTPPQSAAATVGTSEKSPARGEVVVFKNGRLMRGMTLREGERIRLTRSDRSVVRIPVEIVDFIAPNLTTAYQHQAGRLKDRDNNGRLRLIQWCLQYEMVREAAEQLAVLRFQTPDNPKIDYLQRRIAQQLRPTPAASGASRALPGKAVSFAVDINKAGGARAATPAELNRLVKQLPTGAVEEFTHVIQPMLVNRCGATACHGVLADSPYRLIRPSIEGAFSHRYTQRNLHSTIKHVRAGPLADTAWIRAATSPHAGRKKPFFGESEIEQLGRLVAWARQVSRVPVNHDPIARMLADREPANGTSAQQADSNRAKQSGSSTFRPAGFTTPRDSRAGAKDSVRRASLSQSNEPSPPSGTASPNGTSTPTSTSADPFDPKAFNREASPKANKRSDD